MVQMTQANLIAILSLTRFPEAYWSLCDRHPTLLSANPSRPMKKQELISAFDSAGTKPRYDARDRSLTLDLGKLDNRAWEGVFSAQRSGFLELALFGKGEHDTIGSNFAVLAYDAKRHADPNFSRDRFNGPPPYPRPAHNGQVHQLVEIVRGFLELLGDAKAALEAASKRPA
jgi:hypothetical protein